MKLCSATKITIPRQRNLLKRIRMMTFLISCNVTSKISFLAPSQIPRLKRKREKCRSWTLLLLNLTFSRQKYQIQSLKMAQTKASPANQYILRALPLGNKPHRKRYRPILCSSNTLWQSRRWCPSKKSPIVPQTVIFQVKAFRKNQSSFLSRLTFKINQTLEKSFLALRSLNNRRCSREKA